MKIILVSVSIFFIQKVVAQTPVKDNANNGQAKRMTSQQWDDWQPTPETGWFGIPKNLEGWFYWRVLHKSYYNGEDSRPYRPDGPFMENYASLSMQEKDDAHINDSIQKVMETNLATFVSMSGGTADVAWSMYFGNQFDKLTSEVVNRLQSISNKYPVAASKMSNNTRYREYLEYLEIQKDKLQTIHNSLVDRGERIVAYLEIQKQIQQRNTIIHRMISNYIQLTKLPTPEKIEVIRTKKPIPTNDSEIVKKILTNFNF